MRSGNGGRHHAHDATPAESDAAPMASLLATIIDPDGRDAPATSSPIKLFDATVPRPRTESSAHIFGELPVDELPAPEEMPVLGAPEARAATVPHRGDAAVPTVAQPDADANDDTDTMPAVAAETSADVIEADSPGLADGHPLKRTKVTLSPPAKRHDEVRVYIAPPPDGLGKFDLGTVPASVTPPRTWRKAAWFAAMSSGGVVVALLVAGSYLVGTPAEQVVMENWPGLQVDPPYLFEGSEETTSQRRSRADRTSDPQRISDVAGVQTGRPRTSLPAGDADMSTSAPGASTTTGAPTTTSAEPSKPPAEPAARETKTPPFGFYPDAETMGDRSERFLNAITEDPDAAHQETGGELYAEGADGIAAAYAEIAYFEVEHIYIDQRNRQTISSVTVVWKDGHTTSEQRTLKFEDGDKITDDGTG